MNNFIPGNRVFINGQFVSSQERITQLNNSIDRGETALQQSFEDAGGEGPVKDFLVWGATDERPGIEKHWETMTPEQQGLWNDLSGRSMAITKLKLDAADLEFH